MAGRGVVRSMEWVLLIAQLPAKGRLAAGILLLDHASDELHIQLLPELSEVPEDIAEVWRELQQDLTERAREQGGTGAWDSDDVDAVVGLARCPVFTAGMPNRDDFHPVQKRN